MAAETSPPEHLFVYGTLLSRTGHPMGRLLRENARLAGEAKLNGVLYLVESHTAPASTGHPAYYPALVSSENPGDTVHGELYALEDPGILRSLDAYEECGPGFPEPREYVRVQQEVETAGGVRVLAWVYLYNLPVDGLRRIDGGRWPASGPSRS